MIWMVEHRATTRRLGPPRFVPLDSIEFCRGFRGVYAHPAHIAAMATEQRHMRGLVGSDLYSDTLFLDFDNNPDAAARFASHLTEMGVGYQQFDSGNRSVHFHVPIVTMIGPAINLAQRDWVKRHAPGADVTFYHPAGLYRITGTFHVKNPGHCKHLTDQMAGAKLEIPAWTGAMPKPVSSIEADMEDREGLLAALLKKEVGEGERTPHLYKIVRTARSLGFTYSEVIEDCHYWNAHNAHPSHDPTYVEKKVTEIWGRE